LTISAAIATCARPILDTNVPLICAAGPQQCGQLSVTLLPGKGDDLTGFVRLRMHHGRGDPECQDASENCFSGHHFPLVVLPAL
jgi:hypothetical protein